MIGHITADLLADGGVQAGGTALYAALTAHQLGVRTGILTACAADLDLSWLPPDVQLVREPTAQSSTFSNRYNGNERTQYLLHQATAIQLDRLPAAWQSAQIVHLGPVAQEVPMVAHRFPDALVGATPQGWLRSWDGDGRVRLHPARLRSLDLGGIRTVVLSEEDIERDETLIDDLAARVETVVLTRAERGATVCDRGRRYDVPAFPTTVVDPTGAGDVFAAAFLIGLWQGKTVELATLWGHAAASGAIMGPGTSTLPTADEVARRIAGAAAPGTPGSAAGQVP